MLAVHERAIHPKRDQDAASASCRGSATPTTFMPDPAAATKTQIARVPRPLGPGVHGRSGPETRCSGGRSSASNPAARPNRRPALPRAAAASLRFSVAAVPRPGRGPARHRLKAAKVRPPSGRDILLCVHARNLRSVSVSRIIGRGRQVRSRAAVGQSTISWSGRATWRLWYVRRGKRATPAIYFCFASRSFAQ